MNTELNRHDIEILLECLSYKEKGIRDRSYISNDAEEHRADYALRQEQFQEVDALKEKLRSLRDSP